MNAAKQLFTLAEANRALPLVRKIVSDVLRVGQHLRTLAANSTVDVQHHPEGGKWLAELTDLLAELEAIGCSYRDFNFTIGLVDFPAIIDNEKVCLCWRSDEPEIKYYHGINAGYAGRQPIPPNLIYN